MSVITISRQFGCGGDEIAEAICKQTGYRLFDKHILVKAAQEAGLSEAEVIDYSEDQYEARRFFERLFGRPQAVAQVRMWKEDLDGVRTVELMELDEQSALRLVRSAVEKAYQMGNMVIVGRGGQVILRNKLDVLHVRVAAPLEERIQRVRARLRESNRRFSTSLEERRAAQDLIAARDMASADYLKRIYGVDWSDPLLYDLVINTRRMGTELAARLIVEAVEQLSGVPETA
ncbi:MAG: cytidylate kinase-like family protein [Chloroflexota bacterium]